MSYKLKCEAKNCNNNCRGVCRHTNVRLGVITENSLTLRCWSYHQRQAPISICLRETIDGICPFIDKKHRCTNAGECHRKKPGFQWYRGKAEARDGG